MSDPVNFRMRIFYRKSGRIALLSHLEVARSLERAVRRAKLPYAISQGFSPHMKIAFGSALPVGVGGEQECFDLQLTRYVAPDSACEALQGASAQDLMVTACSPIGPRDPAASVAYPISTYRVELSDAPASKITVPETITVIRKKKEKVLKVDEFLLDNPMIEGSTMTFALRAKPTGSLRVDTLIRELIADQPGIRVRSITRIDQREV